MAAIGKVMPSRYGRSVRAHVCVRVRENGRRLCPQGLDPLIPLRPPDQNPAKNLQGANPSCPGKASLEGLNGGGAHGGAADLRRGRVQPPHPMSVGVHLK